ncbi:universal stress protein [Mucilaginibacter lappiensis]|uniref:Nucleotide-binding universal stress UspA family protein n=1 Tax=Mucilaginibacter lappiensis TaxID=354630 RepID=A0A1N7DCR1_9SPHI|nr:universal stress protein [Mucilaginibacter lappiensis]MBB6111234.1 nucleotide-binding universal stress UspA family protein [Mucilaginibacter lappiensis]MBB6129521.1 nucleotide-binding universal stress UspA family protein [Mucilaginibacter lappiensis]SIR73537.1 Nucleotide-binding universal stress protein, UspA family [Mucilaginibacter lappiensis]
MKISKILIGIDDSAYARNAAAYGFDMARDYKAAVGLVHIIEPMVIPSTPADNLTGISMDSAFGIQEVELSEVQTNQTEILINNTIKEFGDGLEITAFKQYGSRADGIIDCCKEFDADIIVIGTHKRSGFDRLLIGSVAEHVVRHSAVPVLVVPFVE